MGFSDVTASGKMITSDDTVTKRARAEMAASSAQAMSTTDVAAASMASATTSMR
jgi:hypothetical protein